MTERLFLDTRWQTGRHLFFLKLIIDSRNVIVRSPTVNEIATINKNALAGSKSRIFISISLVELVSSKLTR
jgi:hypothetical protein